MMRPCDELQEEEEEEEALRDTIEHVCKKKDWKGNLSALSLRVTASNLISVTTGVWLLPVLPGPWGQKDDEISRRTE